MLQSVSRHIRPEMLTRGNCLPLGGSICMDLLTSDGVFDTLRFL